MGRALVTFFVTLFVGYLGMGVGYGLGHTELGLLVAIAVAGGLIVFFNGNKEKK